MFSNRNKLSSLAIMYVRYRTSFFKLTPEYSFINNLCVSLALGAAGGHMDTEHEWEKLYHAAVLETDWSKMG